MPFQTLGMLLALCAAALNATIGVLSKLLMNSGFSPSAIAFYKTTLATVLLSGLLFVLKKTPPTLGGRAKWWQAAICSLLGIFVLFFFETKAYAHENAATVVVVLMASAAFSSILLARIFLGDPIEPTIIIGAALAVSGVFMIFKDSMEANVNAAGVLFAALAGLGYGAFSVCMKKMQIRGGLFFTRQLLFFGSLYLFLPALSLGELSINLTLYSAAILAALAVLPTILGFFCTTKAIELLKPSQVQIIELTEPLFAGVLAFVFIAEVPGLPALYGAALIVGGLLFANNLLSIPGTGNRQP